MSVQHIHEAQHLSPEQRIRAALETQRRAFQAEGPVSAATRVDRLDRCIDLLLRHEDALCQAMSSDFSHRSLTQSRLTDIFPSIDALKHARKHLRGWMKTRRRRASFPMNLTGAKARLRYQPKGVVGVISPWNFPLHLCFTPLSGILAAGNRAMIKPSEFTPATSQLLAEVIAEAFDPAEITVITGDAQVGIAFSKQPFDHLLFTGSTSVGRHVMRAAAEHLVPVTLELGGKSPAVVGNSADIAKSAHRIVAGKMLNAGQICIAPDYAFVPSDRVDAFVAAAVASAERLYPNPATNPDYTAIINDRHLERLKGYIADAQAKGATITQVNPGRQEFGADGTRRLPLTLITDVTDEMEVMQNEIFGPLLPVKTYQDVGQVIDYVNARPRPLALYFFGRPGSEQQRVLDNTISGAVTLNDTIYHVTCEDLPFGGVGDSGMGAYHGFEGFQTFSHARGVFQQVGWDSMALMRPPYGKTLDRALGFLIRK